LNPQDPGRESVDYKSTGLDRMPNISDQRLMPVVGFKPT
jgi:hypothetical protein